MAIIQHWWNLFRREKARYVGKMWSFVLVQRSSQTENDFKVLLKNILT